MKTEVLNANHPIAIKHAKDVIENGGIVAFPTDTVYGLAAQAFNEQSIERLYVIKGRNTTRAIAVLIGDIVDLDLVVAGLSPGAARLVDQFWPGPLTMVVPSNPNLPSNLSPSPNIGVRMPNHPVALDLLRNTGPLAVTSANVSGAANANTAQEVLEQLNGRIHLVLDGGKSPGGIPSTVVDCSGPDVKILREGPIGLYQILSVTQA